MTPAAFRKLALALPGTVESAHMDHPDFRVGGKIFATLACPGEQWGMIKLTPEQQTATVRSAPTIFQPVNGGWGRAGATNVHLRAAKVAPVRLALALAWRNLAPNRFIEKPSER